MKTEADAAIDDLVGRLSLLPRAAIGHGFRHPTSPDSTRKRDYQATLTQYPFLERDPGYLAFLSRYSGAAVYSYPDEDISIHLFGFIDDVFHLLHGPGETVDQDGFMAFGYTELTLSNSDQDVVTLGFSFDATGSRRWGIYRSVRQPGGDTQGPDWYCLSFIEWLRLAIAAKGRLLE